MSALLRVEDVERVIPGEMPVTLVTSIDLEIVRGEFLTIMGPSGSGKSSLLYLLGLLDLPTRGAIWLDGEQTSRFDEDRLADTRLRKLGFVFQFHFLLAEFSALENVLLPMRRLGRLDERDARIRAAMLLDDLGMSAHGHKHPHQLSGGERQRVAIARALANDPPLILADEPTGNLDSASSSMVRDILRNLTREQSKTVVAVSHDSAFAAAADRRVGLVDGQIDPDWAG